MTDGPCGGATAQALTARTETSPTAAIARLMFVVPTKVPCGGPAAIYVRAAEYKVT
jgi:hypothetical protein